VWCGRDIYDDYILALTTVSTSLFFSTTTIMTKLQLKEMGKKEKLKSFELIFDIHIEGKINDLRQGFSVENDCLTPTFKLKRNELKV
jgi:hypothetical protein